MSRYSKCEKFGGNFVGQQIVAKFASADMFHTMNKISATILTFNEARLIEQCLESLRDVADEIIVVDSFSTDATPEICRRNGCRVTQRRMAGFGVQRQYATSLARYPYILSIDADEVLSPALRQSLLRLKKEGFAHRGYKMSRLNFFCGYAVKHCGWYPDMQVRLFDRRYASWCMSQINEQVSFRDDITPELLEGQILHYRCTTPDEYLRRCVKQAELKARDMAESEAPVSSWQGLTSALGEFFSTYIRRGGIFDGSVGLAISRRNYLACRHAYQEAIRLREERRKELNQQKIISE